MHYHLQNQHQNGKLSERIQMEVISMDLWMFQQQQFSLTHEKQHETFDLLQNNFLGKHGQRITTLHELLGMLILIIEQEQRSFLLMHELNSQKELHDLHEKEGIMLHFLLLRMDSKHNRLS